MANPIEENNQLVPAPEGEKEEQLLLDRIRDVLTEEAEEGRLYIAGEVSLVEGHFDIHDIFVSPSIPTFDPHDLAEFTRLLEAKIGPSKTPRYGWQRQDGGLQLPDFFYDEIVGKKVTTITEQTTITTTKGNIDVFKPGTETKSESKERDLKQRTMVKIYPDSYTASLVYGATQGRVQGNAIEVSPELVSAYHTHTLSGSSVEALRQNATQQQKGTPTLPEQL